MNPEERSLLERTHALAQENNEILKVMNRSRKFGLIFKIAYWTIIIGLSIGAFYFIQPMIEAVTDGLGFSNSSQVKNPQSQIDVLKELLGN